MSIVDPLPIKGRGGSRPFQKLSHSGGGGVPKTLVERGDKPEKGVDVEMSGLPLFYYFTVQYHFLCVLGKSKVSFITFQFFSLLS